MKSKQTYVNQIIKNLKKDVKYEEITEGKIGDKYMIKKRKKRQKTEKIDPGKKKTKNFPVT